jgi:hypothetical protein
VLRVEVQTCSEAGVGTGFLLSPRLVATVDHVVDGATLIDLRHNGRRVAFGTVVGEDPLRDVALVRTSQPVAGYRFTLAKRAPLLGEQVALLGYPLGLPLSLSQGTVSGSDRTIAIEGINRRKLIQTDAAVNHGNSGGPLISTTDGTVVGLIDAGTTQANGLGFAVSAQVAAPLLQAWQAGPQPVSVPSCGSTEPPLQAAPAPPPKRQDADVAVYTGQAFSIAYPKAWYVDTAEVSKGSYLDTTIRDRSDPSIYLRVDVTPNAPPTLDANANPVVNALRRQTGYRELAYRRTTFDGYDAIYWEFVSHESGIDLHKIDVFFISGAGSGFGVLTQAPVSKWTQWVPAFTAIRSSLTVNPGS